MRYHMLLNGLILCYLCVTANAVFPEAALDRTVSIDDIRRAMPEFKPQWFGLAVDDIAEAYRVPISFEWSYVAADGSDIEQPETSFKLQAGETLASALDRFCVETQGQLRWDQINGIICVWPTGSGGALESLLDVQVSLNVQGVSTWHALIELLRAINTSAPGDRFVAPDANPFLDEKVPPFALREDAAITLNLSDVSAREAACAIMAASPLYTKFDYSNHYDPHSPNSQHFAKISLWAYDENYELLSDVARTFEERLASRIWIYDFQAVRQSPVNFVLPEP